MNHLSLYFEIYMILEFHLILTTHQLIKRS